MDEQQPAIELQAVPIPVPPASTFDRFLIVAFKVLRFLYVQGELFVAWSLEMYLRRKVARTKLDPNAKCPACGFTKGSIKWMADFPLSDGSKGAIVHRCEICDANWPEKPIVKSDWAIRLSPSVEE